MFQSAPRSRERDDNVGDRVSVNCRVSIRAPLSRAGRLTCELTGREVFWFQSAPRSRERDDECGRFAGDIVPVSIRAPLSRAGRPLRVAGRIDSVVVSIRAPLSRAGRLLMPVLNSATAAFQSAPRSRERDDFLGHPDPGADLVSIRAPLSRAGRHRVRHQLCQLQEVSIRAPLSRAGRLDPSRISWWFVMFQSAPRSRERDDTPAGANSADALKFQSAPRSRERDDLGVPDALPSFSRVSIRAPLSRAGRLIPYVSATLYLLFQSAPRSRERDDCRWCFVQPHRCCFNPRPALASGTTCRRWPCAPV